MSATQPIVWTDAAGANSGGESVVVRYNNASVAQSCLVSGTLPVSSASLSLALPALSLVLNPGDGTAQYVTLPAATLTIAGGGSKDVYLFVNEVGIFTQAAVNTGSGAPATPAGTVPLLVATTNAGNTALTSVKQIISPLAMTAAAIGAADETPVNTTLTPTSSLQDTYHRIFYQIGQMNANVAAAQAVVAGRLATDGSNAAGTVNLAGRLIINQAAPASASQAVALFGNGTLSTASANGSILIASAPNGFTGDLLALLKNNLRYFNVDAYGHLASSSPAPTVAAGAGLGTGGTATLLAGSDTAGNVFTNTGTGPQNSNAVIATVTFAHAYATTPKAVLVLPMRNWAASNFAALGATTISTTGFTVTNFTGYVGLAGYGGLFAYLVIG